MSMREKSLFSKSDLQQMKNLGLSPGDVGKQLATYRYGSNFSKLNRPCIVKDGIISFTPAQRKKLIALYDKESVKYKLIKFVPASGAASRMFAEWFPASKNGSFGSAALDQSFFRDLKRFPFFSLIEKDKRGRMLLGKKNIKGLLNFILSSNCLNFGQIPKALIPFHRYFTGEIRTALEEHLCEAKQYICNKNGVCRLHFTLLRDQKTEVVRFLKTMIVKYEKLYKVKYKITLSIQKSSTNILAVDENNLPLRDANGVIVFRPGGHGTLLKNLSSLNADFIFIKNVDNIAPEPLLDKILSYKKMLGGLAIQIREEMFAYMRQLENKGISLAQLENIIFFCSKKLNIIFPRDFPRQSQKQKIQFLFSMLNRPLRVCGMVKHEGEPGGGPFWVEENDGKQTLQIIESGHVDKSKPEQLAIWSQAKYFNPVDLVCSIKNYKGEKFNLHNYVNNDTYLITSKNEKGLEMKALEVPGLWNGGMAYWNTLFVELPLIVFNPVKTVYDLLRPEHLIQLCKKVH